MKGTNRRYATQMTGTPQLLIHSVFGQYSGSKTYYSVKDLPLETPKL